ncbi:MAG: hypothetical protein VX024_04450, partial [SAR324 cluster bacterium]|nr:hypothetical protein [SAR324 cluster bacterium]
AEPTTRAEAIELVASLKLSLQYCILVGFLPTRNLPSRLSLSLNPTCTSLFSSAACCLQAAAYFH